MPTETIPADRSVFCDMCYEDYTDRPESGGFVVKGYAYCPRCAAKYAERIYRVGEERDIRARCRPGQSFANFVREYRGEDAAITITTGGNN